MLVKCVNVHRTLYAGKGKVNCLINLYKKKFIGIYLYSTVGVVEDLEDNISTLNTSISPLGISPFKKLVNHNLSKRGR